MTRRRPPERQSRTRRDPAGSLSIRQGNEKATRRPEAWAASRAARMASSRGPCWPRLLYDPTVATSITACKTPTRYPATDTRLAVSRTPWTALLPPMSAQMAPEPSQPPPRRGRRVTTNDTSRSERRRTRWVNSWASTSSNTQRGFEDVPAASLPRLVQTSYPVYDLAWATLLGYLQQVWPNETFDDQGYVVRF